MAASAAGTSRRLRPRSSTVASAGALPAGGEPDAGLARLAGALLDAAATPCSLH